MNPDFKNPLQNAPHVGQALQDWLQQNGLSVSLDDWYFSLALLILTFIAGWFALKLAQSLLSEKLTSLVLATKSDWNSAFHEKHLYKRICHIASATTIHLVAPLLLLHDSMGLQIALKLSLIYLIIACVWSIFAMFNTVQDRYSRSKYASRIPIDGFIQVGKLILAVVATLLTVSQLLDKSPTLLLSGLGAITAIVILVFRDAILGFVSGINIVANRTVTNGDWIEMPKYNADGKVLQVGLTTVKVRNWDNTISTIPTSALMSDSIKNWRGMEQSGGRRIKRAIHIDIHSIKFCDGELLEKLSKLELLSDYVADFQQKILVEGQVLSPEKAINYNNFTNVGLYRKYVEAYIKNHPMVNQNLTLIVRQLAPGTTGLPIEIYCFSSDKNWVNYEGIQSDILDHCIAILPLFQLSPYQLSHIALNEA